MAQEADGPEAGSVIALPYLDHAKTLPLPTVAKVGSGAVHGGKALVPRERKSACQHRFSSSTRTVDCGHSDTEPEGGEDGNLPHPAIIGLDVSRDMLDIHGLPDGLELRLPNTCEGHAQLERLARDRRALVCFEATGGHEWLLWASLDKAGIGTRQLPPAQIKAFAASLGVRAKTDRIDAEMIALFMAFRPEAGRRLPHAKLRNLRALATKRRQLVGTLKRHSLQCKAREKHGTACDFEDFDNEFKDLMNRQIKELEQRIEILLASDAELAGTAAILRSIPGIGPVACAMLIAEMPELGQITGDKAAALAGLAPVARDSGQMGGKRAIGGGRRALRCVLYQAALVASHHNADMEIFAKRLRDKGKPHKVVVTAVARKLITVANALCKTRRSWAARAA